MKYGLIGFDGRLGSEVVKVFEEAEHTLVYGKSAEEILHTDDPEVLIDCSLPDAFDHTVDVAQELSIPLVMAVTGLDNEKLDFLRVLSRKIPVVQSYNFSVGIQVLLKLTEEANSILGDWDIEISETHHRFKKDKPSGTALMIKDKLGKEVNINSFRLGNVAGDHTISFGGLGEVLNISHRALSRRTFAEGILRSAQFVLEVKPDFYSFTDVIFGQSKNINWR